MSTYEIILKRRTVRKFKQQKIEEHVLQKLINAARFAPSGANMQPLKYIIVDDNNMAGKVFENVKWAGYISPDGNPGENERPVAYIVVLVDTDIRKSGWERDSGAAVQNILLAATEEGVGTCWMGAIDRDEIRKLIEIPERFVIDTVIALGYEGERPVTEEENGSIKYYKDEKNVLHVPKRKIKDIIL